MNVLFINNGIVESLQRQDRLSRVSDLGENADPATGRERAPCRSREGADPAVTLRGVVASERARKSGRDRFGKDKVRQLCLGLGGRGGRVRRLVTLRTVFPVWTRASSSATVNGIVDRHNLHYWATENPHWMRQANSQVRWSVNVWAGILGDHIIGPHFIDGRVDGEGYRNFLRDKLVDLLDEVPLESRVNMWFQQDGHPAHTAKATRDLLNKKFGRRWIGLHGLHEWPPRSPDLTPLDFFLWGHLKEQVYATRPVSVQDFKERIVRACRTISPEILRREQLKIGREVTYLAAQALQQSVARTVGIFQCRVAVIRSATWTKFPAIFDIGREVTYLAARALQQSVARSVGIFQCRVAVIRSATWTKFPAIFDIGREVTYLAARALQQSVARSVRIFQCRVAVIRSATWTKFPAIFDNMCTKNSTHDLLSNWGFSTEVIANFTK
ncbi:PREDICTED: uncharacterized protein LOC105558173 [Vollenhovia emeryi]|uniref:uncharacterized protein LOC105558173 n=1 Tax=Vollenhovia emeryi TaxID=411798 RepID=UPI0005F53711|nr:PREDICTED: uncharacterized protein LOC105558173 [Vollenhovia emeryi]